MSSTEQLSISERVFGYVPNSALALAVTIVYATIGAALLFRVARSKAWWALCLPIGSLLEMLGFALRYASNQSPNNVSLFAVQQLLIVCSPAAFLAFNYIVYGRLISYIGAEHSIINPRKVAKVFVISDVATFMIQAGGSGLTASEKTANIGEKVILSGLVLQAISYGFFCLLLVKSHISIKSAGGSSKYDSCVVIIWALYFSSAFISLRCGYRSTEFALGHRSYLLTHEVFLYTLDVLPLILAIVVYIPWWPTKYIKHDKSEDLEMDAAFRH